MNFMLIFVRKKVHLGDSLLGVLQMTEDRMNRMAMSSPAIDRVLTLNALPAPVEKAIFLLGQRKEARQLSLTSNDVTSQFSPSISSTNQGTQEKVRYVQGTSDSYTIVPTGNRASNDVQKAINQIFKVSSSNWTREVNLTAIFKRDLTQACQCGAFGLRPLMCACAFTGLSGVASTIFDHNLTLACECGAFGIRPLMCACAFTGFPGDASTTNYTNPMYAQCLHPWVRGHVVQDLVNKVGKKLASLPVISATMLLEVHQRLTAARLLPANGKMFQPRFQLRQSKEKGAHVHPDLCRGRGAREIPVAVHDSHQTASNGVNPKATIGTHACSICRSPSHERSQCHYQVAPHKSTFMKETPVEATAEVTAVEATAEVVVVAEPVTAASDLSRSVDSVLSKIPKGAQVWYVKPDGSCVIAKVVNVHYDDHPPYYTILIDGHERSTVRTKLNIVFSSRM
jgi:hypothetical protein